MYKIKSKLIPALFAFVTACTSTDNNDEEYAYDAGYGLDARAPAIDARTPVIDAQPSAPDAAVGKKAYVGLFGDSAVAVFDTASKHVIKTVPVTAPDGLVLTPDGKKVYVSSTDTGTVKVIDTATDEITNSIDVGSKPAGLAIDDHWLVVAVGGANEAVIVDTRNDTIVRHAAVGQAHASCITADGHFAYVGSQVTTAPAVVEVDLRTEAPPRVLPVDKSPRMLACEANGIYFTAVGLDAVELLDPSTGSLTTPISTGGSPHDIRASGNTELTVSQTAGDLEFIDVASATVVARLPTGKLAHWIALDGTSAYITNEGDNNVSIVDLARRVVTDTVSVGKAPRKMAVQP